METLDHHPTICYSRYSHMFNGMSDCWRVNPEHMVQIGFGGATSMQDRNVGHAQSREALNCSPIAVDFRFHHSST